MALVVMAMAMLAADRLESEDAHDICQIADACEEKEEGVQSFRGFTAVIEQELRDSAPEVEDCADVPEYLTPEAEVE